MTMVWRPLMFALLLALAAIGPASTHQDITGGASVIDGDTIEVHGQRNRLYGIDAPESSQLCVRPNGERWRCGQRGIQFRHCLYSPLMLCHLILSFFRNFPGPPAVLLLRPYSVRLTSLP